MHTLTKRLLAVSAAGALALTALTGCGSDNATKSGSMESSSSAAAFSGKIAGAGASSQEAAQNAWKATFMQKNASAQVTYDPVGSGAGIDQLGSGQVNWAGSDAVMKKSERARVEKVCGSPALHLPAYISPVAVVFNLPGIKKLNMHPDVIAKIFSGQIKKWNDPAIAADNKGVNLPDMAITPVHRADESGTTDNFTDYLHQAAPQAWPHEADKSWPLPGGEAAPQTAGVISTVRGGKGTIGYADASQANGLGTVALAAGDSFVPYSAEAAAKAVDVSDSEPGMAPNDLALKIDRKPTDAGAYPLVLVSYEIVCSHYKDKNVADGVKAYIGFITSAEGQQLAAHNAGSAPISEKLRQRVNKALASVKGGK